MAFRSLSSVLERAANKDLQRMATRSDMEPAKWINELAVIIRVTPTTMNACHQPAGHLIGGSGGARFDTEITDESSLSSPSLAHDLVRVLSLQVPGYPHGIARDGNARPTIQTGSSFLGCDARGGGRTRGGHASSDIPLAVLMVAPEELGHARVLRRC